MTQSTRSAFTPAIYEFATDSLPYQTLIASLLHKYGVRPTQGSVGEPLVDEALASEILFSTNFGQLTSFMVPVARS